MKQIFLTFITLLGLAGAISAQGVPELIYLKFNTGTTSTPNDAASGTSLAPTANLHGGFSIGGIGMAGTGLVGTGAIGSTDYVDLSSTATITGSYTISFWVNNVPTMPSTSYLFGSTSNGMRCFTGGVGGNGLYFRLDNTYGIDLSTTIQFQNSTAPAVYTFTYDATTGVSVAYKDGVQIGSVTGLPSNLSIDMSTFKIGSYSSSNGLSGIMDEFRLYNRALSASEILATYNQELPLTSCSGMPVAGNAHVSNHTVCLNQNVLLSVIGSTMAAGLTYQWESSATANGTYTPISGATVSNYFVTPAVGTTFYRVAVTCNGQTAYSTPDSVVVPNGFPGGTFTIDPAQPSSATNFQTVSDAFAAIGCGLTGSVTFNMAPGHTFNEQVSIPSTLGSSAAHTVTLNGNGDTLTYNASSSAPWTLGIEGTGHITVNDLVIQGTSTTYALGVHLWNGADSNTFNNCTILVPTVSTTTVVPFSASGSATSAVTTGTSGSGNVLDSCTLVGGYYGATFYASGALAQGNKILNSTIRDFYYYGSYNYYQSGLVLKGNHISRPNATTISSFYGIYVSTGCTDVLIESNRLDHQCAAVPGGSYVLYNIYVSSTAATVGNEIKIFNNVIGNLSGNSSAYGIYLPSAINVQVYNNTVSIDNTAATTGTVYGIYSTGTTGVDIKNNIISITQGGTGTKYGLYYSTQNPTSNYNDIFIGSTTGTINYGYASGAVASFALWQAANGGAFDQNSISEDPLFADPGNGDFTPTNAAVNDKGTPVPGVTTDILGVTRSTTTPDMGAYEFTVANCSGTVTAGTIDNGPTSSVCGATPLSLHASNATSPAAGLTYQWQQRVPSGTGAWQDIPGATLVTLNLPNGITSPTDFRAYMACSFSSSSDTTTPVTVNLNPASQCYCTPPAPSIGGLYWIESFSTTGGITNISNLNTGASVSGYADYTMDTVKVSPSGSFNFNLQAQSGSSPGVSIWIDWNQDGAFDQSELVYDDNGGSSSSLNTYTGLINVPVNAAVGSTRLRIRNYTNRTPCGAQSYGEAEDYTVSIMSLTACTGQPVAGGIDTGSFGICSGDPFILSDTGFTIAGNMTYQWQQKVGTGSWTNIVGANGNAYALSNGITANTSFRFYVVCGSSNLADTTAPITVSLNPANQCYCTPPAPTIGGLYWIQSFSTTNALSNISNLNTGASANGYADYTTDTVKVAPGMTFNFDIQAQSGASPGVSMWIDWDQSGTFDANELVYASTAGSTSALNTYLDSVTVPVSALPGSTRLRIRNYTNPTPCGSQSYGEAEDYILSVEAPNCTIVADTLTALSVGSTSAILSWTGTALQYMIEYGAPGFTQGSGTQVLVTHNPDTLTGLNPNTDYQFYVQNICYPGYDSADWSVNPGSFHTICDTPLVSLGADTTVCEGQPLTLATGNNNTGNTYLWSDGTTNSTLAVNASGTYWAKVTNQFGCSHTDSITITVTPIPHVDDITAVHNGDDSYTFTANGASSNANYSWDFGDGQGFSSSPNPTYLYGAYGDYTVTLILSNDCGADTTQLIVHYTSGGDGNNGISNVDPGKNLLKLYPNPARDIVTLSNESSQKMQTVEVYNVLGQRIFKANTNNGSTYQLHVDGYASGMYSVKIFFEDGTWAQRKFEIAK